MPEVTQAYRSFLLAAPRGRTITEGHIDLTVWRRLTFQVEAVPSEYFVVIGVSYFCKSNLQSPLWSVADVLGVKKGVAIDDPLFGAFCVQHAIGMYGQKMSSGEPATNVTQFKPRGATAAPR